jgi:hypothetical protein
MSTDQAQAARAAGKAATRERTIWTLEAAGLATRCLELRPGGWRKLAEGARPAALLLTTATYYASKVIL